MAVSPRHRAADLPAESSDGPPLIPDVAGRRSSDGNCGGRSAPAAAQVDAPRVQPRDRVDLAAVHLAPGVHLEVQVRAGGLSAIADLGDLLAGRDPLADAHEVAVHMAVD